MDTGFLLLVCTSANLVLTKGIAECIVEVEEPTLVDEEPSQKEQIQNFLDQFSQGVMMITKKSNCLDSEALYALSGVSLQIEDPGKLEICFVNQELKNIFN